MRSPAVAGRFYPGRANELRSEVAELLGERLAAPEAAIAAMVPHAGYLYSGRFAAQTYRRIDIPRRVIILCPNHTGDGAQRAVWPRGEWTLPGGAVPVDEELATRVAQHAGICVDTAAHRREHAIEVQLPLLRALCPELHLVPICLATASFESCQQMGCGLADAIMRSSERVLLVASTDMSHYVPAAVAARNDALALERVLALDPAGLYDVVRDHEISMCGYIPTVVTLVAARQLGAARAELVCYGHSGEVTGDSERVVAYAGAIVR